MALIRSVAHLILSPLLVLGATVAQSAADAFDARAIAAHIEASRTRALAACDERGIALPQEFLAWIDADPVRRASVYGCRKDALRVLLALRSLEIDLGEELVRDGYPQLALAFAIQGSYGLPRALASDWNDGDGHDDPALLPDLTPRARLELVIPGDPRVRVDTKDPARTLDRDDHIVNFLEDHAPIEVEVTTKEQPPLEYDERGVAKPQRKPIDVTRTVRRPLLAADVIASRSLQGEFNAYLAARGFAESAIDCGDRVVHWQSGAAVPDAELRRRIASAFEMFRDAYRAKGRLPAQRDRAPSAAESMAWFIRNDRHPFTETERAARGWPKFPLDAPWPLLLMLAADDQPLREREDVWLRFRDHGEFRTYGEYIGGIAQQFDMQSARRVAPLAFDYGSIQMMQKDGGVCGTMGNIGARTYRICGVPASTVGQPGHCAIVFMERDGQTGEFRCRGGQYATGGDEVTTVHASWNHDDIGGRKPMVWHQSVAWGVHAGFASWVDGLVLRRIWDALPAERRAAEGVAFVRAAVACNPFALAAIEAAFASAVDAASASALHDAFVEAFDRVAKPDEFPLYRSAVRQLAQSRSGR